MTASNPASALERDPVCGMNVNPASAKHVYEHAGKKYFFCCAGCVEKFKADPGKYLNKPQPGVWSRSACRHPRNSAIARAAPGCVTSQFDAAPKSATAGPAYVCPMCPEVRESKPGACPSCGMALEPDVPRGSDAHRIHLPDASPDRALRARFVPHLRDGS